MCVEVKRLNLGTTIIYVTHDQVEAMTLATGITGLARRLGAAIRRAGGSL